MVSWQPENGTRLDVIPRRGGAEDIRWFEIEPEPGVFVDAQGNSTWAKYDRIVDAAAVRGITILPRLEKRPAWALAGRPTPAGRMSLRPRKNRRADAQNRC